MFANRDLGFAGWAAFAALCRANSALMHPGAVQTVLIVPESQPHVSPSLYGGTLHGLCSVHPQ
jgi:hypothetical protein